MPKSNKSNNNNNNKNQNAASKNSQQSSKKSRKDMQNRMVTSSAPLAINVRSKGVAPSMMSGKGGTVVSHTEVLSSSVPALATFGLTHTIAVQPGISTVSRGLPMGNWLPQIANQYDHYEFLKLKVRYIPTCATTRDGLVMLSFEPNPEDNPPTDFVTFKNAVRNVSGPVREPVALDVTDLVRKKLLVRAANVSALPLYDIGKIYVASMNGNDLSAGYLEIDYSVRFSNPQSNLGTTALALVGTPTFRTRISTDITPCYFGRTNAARNYARLNTDFFAAEATKEGDQTLVVYDPLQTNGNLQYNMRGCSYYAANNVTIGAFRFGYTGTYRVSWYLIGDFLDYVPFRTNLLKVTMPLVGTGPLASEATTIVATVGGSGLSITSDDGGSRGFSVPSVPSVDVPLICSTLVTVTSTLDRYCIAVGVWGNAAITEAETGSFLTSTSYGQSALKVEYISTATTY